MTTKLNPEKLDGGEQNKYRCIAPNHSHWTLNHAATARCEYAPSPQPSAEATDKNAYIKSLGFVPCVYGCGGWVHPNPSDPDSRQSVTNHLCMGRLAEVVEQFKLLPPLAPAPSGETRGTCPHSAISHSVEFCREHHFILERMWKPLAPEATPAKCAHLHMAGAGDYGGTDVGWMCIDCGMDAGDIEVELDDPDPANTVAQDLDAIDKRPDAVAPGEAVGRPERCEKCGGTGRNISTADMSSPMCPSCFGVGAKAVGRETKSEGGGMEYAGAPDMRLEGGDTSKDSPVAGSNPAPPTNFEAVGRETGEQKLNLCTPWCGNHKQFAHFVELIEELRNELSTLRRERDQREEDFTKWKENRKSREDTLAKAINRIKPNEYIGGFIHECAIDLLAKLESQVRELTGAMKAQDEREAKAGELCGVSRELHGCDWPDAVAERVSEWRTMANYGSMEEIDTPEKLRGYLETILAALEESTESETRLREGLRELAERYEKAECATDYAEYEVRKCGAAIRALLSLEGDKTAE